MTLNVLTVVFSGISVLLSIVSFFLANFSKKKGDGARRQVASLAKISDSQQQRVRALGQLVENITPRPFTVSYEGELMRRLENTGVRDFTINQVVGSEGFYFRPGTGFPRELYPGRPVLFWAADAMTGDFPDDMELDVEGMPGRVFVHIPRRA